MALPVVAAAPTIAADVISTEGSVIVESYPSVKQLSLEKFDDEDGRLRLTKVTVTGTVEGELDGSITNLSASRSKTLTGDISARIAVTGPGVSGLTAEDGKATAWTLAAGETREIRLAASGTTVETITDPARLDDFVGSGTLGYDVDSEVSVRIDGPAPYRTTGAAGGKATIRVDYTYDVCVESPTAGTCVELPPCETAQLTISPVVDGDYVLPGGGTFSVINLGNHDQGWSFAWNVAGARVESITVRGSEPLGSVVTEVPSGVTSGDGLHAPAGESGAYVMPDSVIVCASSDEAPPQECVTATDKIDPVAAGDYVLANGGTFTITSIEDRGSGPVFDWTSTAPVAWISVKGGPQAIGGQLYDYRPDGSYGDEGLHSMLNPHNGTWYGLSHLTICAGDTVDCGSAPDAPGCGGSEPCATEPASCEPSSSKSAAKDEDTSAAPVDRTDGASKGAPASGGKVEDQPSTADETLANRSDEVDTPSRQPQEEPTPDGDPLAAPSAAETPAGE